MANSALELWQHKFVLMVLSAWDPPQGAFDPEQGWEHDYELHFVNIHSKGGGPASPVQGKLRIALTPGTDGLNLRVEDSRLIAQDMTALDMHCRKDRLCSPVSWSYSFSNQQKGSEKLVAYKGTGSLQQGVLTKGGRKVEANGMTGDCTCDWSLFEAVQRLPQQAFPAPIEFGIYESLEAPHANQKLIYRGQTRLKCRQKEVPVHDYLHWGDGGVPTHYFVDEHRRLIMVLGPRMLYVLTGEKTQK